MLELAVHGIAHATGHRGWSGCCTARALPACATVPYLVIVLMGLLGVPYVAQVHLETGMLPCGSLVALLEDEPGLAAWTPQCGTVFGVWP